MYAESISVHATAMVITSLYLYFFMTERLDRMGWNIAIYILYPTVGAVRNCLTEVPPHY